MTLSAALFLMAQATFATAAGGASDAAPATSRASTASPIATVTASAKILRPVSVRVRRAGDSVVIDASAAQKPQAERDSAGMLWIEFS